MTIAHPSGWPTTPDWEDVAFWRHAYTIYMRTLVDWLNSELRAFDADPALSVPSLPTAALRDYAMKHIIESNAQLRSLEWLRRGMCPACGKKLPPQPAGRKFCKRSCGLLYRQRKHQFKVILKDFEGITAKVRVAPKNLPPAFRPK
jgi:hypothetical protein